MKNIWIDKWDSSLSCRLRSGIWIPANSRQSCWRQSWWRVAVVKESEWRCWKRSCWSCPPACTCGWPQCWPAHWYPGPREGNGRPRRWEWWPWKWWPSGLQSSGVRCCRPTWLFSAQFRCWTSSCSAIGDGLQTGETNQKERGRIGHWEWPAWYLVPICVLILSRLCSEATASCRRCNPFSRQTFSLQNSQDRSVTDFACAPSSPSNWCSWSTWIAWPVVWVASRPPLRRWVFWEGLWWVVSFLSRLCRRFRRPVRRICPPFPGMNPVKPHATRPDQWRPEMNCCPTFLSRLRFVVDWERPSPSWARCLKVRNFGFWAFGA